MPVRSRRIFLGTVAIIGLIAAALIIDAEWSKDSYFIAHQGLPISAETDPADRPAISKMTLRLSNPAGLSVQGRVLRPANVVEPLRTLIVIGGHRTGSRAVELVGTPEECAVLALDYPYRQSGEQDGLIGALKALAGVRRAVLDTAPAIFMALSWLERQDWVDPDRIELVGVSLGVPFAATAAALDTRIRHLWLVHGAADNYRWLKRNVGLRGYGSFAQPPLARILYWGLYARSFDTEERIRSVAPRPVTIIGAREDERTPAGETEALYAAAGEPKQILWTDGGHIEPDRTETIRELMVMLEVR